MQVVTNALLGNNTATIAVNDTVFGDPCLGTQKWLFVQATYSPQTPLSSYNCSNIGIHPVVLTGTDEHGNKAWARAKVTIVDTTAPSAPMPVTVHAATTATYHLQRLQIIAVLPV